MKGIKQDLWNTPNMDMFCAVLAEMYAVMKWTWGGIGIPTNEDIRKEVMRRIADLEGDNNVKSSECGGIKVERCHLEDGCKYRVQWIGAEIGYGEPK